MSLVWEFISEMNAGRMCEISRDLMPVINEDEQTRDYRTRVGEEKMFNTPLYNIQEMFMSCLQEMPESGNTQIYLQDYVIDKSTEHSEQLQRLLKQNKTSIKSIYINTNYTYNSLCEIIDLFSLTNLGHLQKLVYCGEVRSKKTEINQILFPSLQNVTLLNGEWISDEENLSKNLARVQNLQYLYFDNFELSHKILEAFFNFISGKKILKQLTFKLKILSRKEHDFHDCKRWNLDLSQHLTLSKLHLQLPERLQLNISTPSLVDVTLEATNLEKSSVLLSRDMLNIESVELNTINISSGSLQNFISVLENLPKSVTVKMLDIRPEEEYGSVREIIRRSQTFHVIRDCKDWCGWVIEFQTRKPS
jgi:hypothetical protein